MAKSGITVTGELEINGNIERFVRDVAPAEIRKGTRDAAKLVKTETVVRTPVEAENGGSMRDAYVVRAVKRSRKRIGHSVVLDRNKLFKLYQVRKGKTPNPRSGEDVPFFYPTVFELGLHNKEPMRPMRGALYENETGVKSEFAKSLLRAVNNPKIKKKR